MSTEMCLVVLLYVCCRRQRQIGEDVAVSVPYSGRQWMRLPLTSYTEHVIVTMHVSRQRGTDD